jgi:hypothetical protein
MLNAAPDIVENTTINKTPFLPLGAQGPEGNIV